MENFPPATICRLCNQSFEHVHSMLNHLYEQHCPSDQHLFDRLWDQQFKFMKLLQEKRNWPEFPVDIASKTGQQFIESIMFHCMKELFEANNELKNSKGHRVTEINDFDRKAYVEELIDAQHLLFEIAIASGITKEEYTEAYLSKGDVNEDRIKNGY